MPLIVERSTSMIAKPKYKDHQGESDRDDGEHIRREKALDEALKNTFPASDPVSVEQPMAAYRQKDRRGHKLINKSCQINTS